MAFSPFQASGEHPFIIETLLEMQSSLERLGLARTCVVSTTGDKKLYSQAYNNLPGPLDECLRKLVCSCRIS